MHQTVDEVALKGGGGLHVKMLDVRVGSCSVLGYVMNDVTSKLVRYL